MIPATKKDEKYAVDIITQAFDTNPSVNWVVKNDTRRRKRIRALARYSFRNALRNNGAYFSSAKNGIALCYQINHNKFSLAEYWNQLILVITAIGPGRIGKVLKRESYIDTIRPKNEDYLYFWFYGVKPGNHNSGDASELKDDIFRIADEKQLPIYLETSVEKNMRVYSRYGFELYHTWNVEDRGIKLYFMRRMPLAMNS